MSLPPNFAPLRYLIGADDSRVQGSNEIVEFSYDSDHGETHYGTLTSEKERFRTLKQANAAGKYKPYLPANDITNSYGEWCPSPRGRGFLQNVHDQVERLRTFGCLRMELDNPDYDGLDVAYVLEAHDLAWQAGLRTIAKNPNNTSDPERYMAHESIDLVVVEHGAGGSDVHEELRQAIGQPLLAIRFVAFGGGERWAWAHNVADNIKRKGLRNMGVTVSLDGEYTDFHDIILPIR